jgi:hypothetical protein
VGEIVLIDARAEPFFCLFTRILPLTPSLPIPPYPSVGMRAKRCSYFLPNSWWGCKGKNWEFFGAEQGRSGNDENEEEEDHDDEEEEQEDVDDYCFDTGRSGGGH